MARVVVIGAGSAGLAAAIRLADFGHDVTVVERADVVGGQLASVTAGGLEFDLGPVSFTVPAVLRDLFRKTGRPLERVLDLVPVDPAARYVFADGQVLDLPNASRAATAEAMTEAFGAPAAAEWDAMLRTAGRMWDVVRPRVLDRPFSVVDALRLAARRTPATRGNLHDFASAQLHDSRLRALLLSYGVAVGADPSRAPAGLAVLAYAEQAFGVWTVAGGVRGLVAALESRAVERGATLLTGRTVERIVVDAGRVSGVELDDATTTSADVVVSTTDVEQLERRLLGRRRRSSALPGTSVLSVLLDLDGSPGLSLPARTVLAPEPGAPSAVLNRMPTGGHAVLSVTVAPHGRSPGELDWSDAETAARYAEATLTACSARGLDLGSGLWLGLRTPADLEAATGAQGGRLHGTSWLSTGALRRRPGNRSSVRGLYLAGAATHPGASLPLAVASAAIVADLVGRA